MPTRLQALRERAKDIQAEIEKELARRREEIGGRIERGRVVFGPDRLRQQRAARQGFRDYVRGIRIPTVVTAPIIYSVLIAFVTMDVMVTLYMWTCFPIYGIPRVRRRDYVVFDRHRLAYLNWIQKVNCLYCGYGNGVIAYAREIAARTEAFWCPIKHATRVAGHHEYYDEFMEYGDEADHVARWTQKRRDLTGRDDVEKPR